MADGNMAEKGSGGALTGDVPEIPGEAELRQALADMQPVADDEPGLFEDGGDSLAIMAQNANAKRARGRPKGSANLRNDALFDALHRMGYKNPVVRLMEIVSADPDALLLGKREDALKLQISAANALLPYMMAKKPQEWKVDKTNTNIFVAVPLTGGAVSETGFSLTGDVIDIAGVSVGGNAPLVSPPLVSNGQAVENAGERPDKTAH